MKLVSAQFPFGSLILESSDEDIPAIDKIIARLFNVPEQSITKTITDIPDIQNRGKRFVIAGRRLIRRKK